MTKSPTLDEVRLEDAEHLQLMVTGRSVGPNPGWQFDLQALDPPRCPGDPGKGGLVSLCMRAYFILVGDDIVVVTAQATGATDRIEFEFAAEEIFSSLSFDDPHSL